jgi:hypothetical protein
MKIKRAIQIIEFSNAILILGLLIGLFAFISKAKDGKFFFLELFFAVPFILTFFFRKLIINIYLKRTPYPGIFYSVLDKLGLAHNLGITLTDDLLNEIYKPVYTTGQFLSDNNLKTEIGINKIKLPFIGLLIALSIVGLFYFSKQYTFKENPMIFVGLFIFIGMGIFLWIRGKKQQNDNDPVVIFTNTHLNLYEEKISWKDIYDWNYITDGKNESGKIVINYYDKEKSINEAMVSFSQIKVDKIDFLLLMTHFKGKYGQIEIPA